MVGADISEEEWKADLAWSVLKDEDPDERLVARNFFNTYADQLNSKHASLSVPRQCGKSTFLWHLFSTHENALIFYPRGGMRYKYWDQTIDSTMRPRIIDARNAPVSLRGYGFQADLVLFDEVEGMNEPETIHDIYELLPFYTTPNYNRLSLYTP